MGTHERWTRLLEILGDKGRIGVVEAAELLEVSTATVRRDMEELARQQLLTRATRPRGRRTRSSVSPGRRPA
jgi:DeoR/GlpR family transcriptional regulator of sugar metabolism